MHLIQIVGEHEAKGAFSAKYFILCQELLERLLGEILIDVVYKDHDVCELYAQAV